MGAMGLPNLPVNPQGSPTQSYEGTFIQDKNKSKSVFSRIKQTIRGGGSEKGILFLQTNNGGQIEVPAKLKTADKTWIPIHIKTGEGIKAVYVKADDLAAKLGLKDAEREKLSEGQVSIRGLKRTAREEGAPATPSTSLTADQSSRIRELMSAKLPELVKLAEQQEGGVLKLSRKAATLQEKGIQHSITITKTGTVFVHLHKEHKDAVGSGGFKVVKQNIPLNAAGRAIRAMQKPETLKQKPNMMRDEYQFYKRFEGPGFAKALGLIAHRGRTGILMDFYPTNFQKMSSTPGVPSAKTKVSGMLQLAVAVAKMHSENVLHLDLKPENVYAEWDPANPEKLEVFLGDLGGCREINKDNLEAMKNWPRTPNYQAPERGGYTFLDDGSIDPVKQYGLPKAELAKAGEMYSLGKTFLEFHLGRSLTVEEAGNFAKREPADKSSVEHLCWRMLQENPKTRPPALEVVRALQQIHASM